MVIHRGPRPYHRHEGGTLFRTFPNQVVEHQEFLAAFRTSDSQIAIIMPKGDLDGGAEKGPEPMLSFFRIMDERGYDFYFQAAQLTDISKTIRKYKDAKAFNRSFDDMIDDSTTPEGERFVREFQENMGDCTNESYEQFVSDFEASQQEYGLNRKGLRTLLVAAAYLSKPSLHILLVRRKPVKKGTAQDEVKDEIVGATNPLLAKRGTLRHAAAKKLNLAHREFPIIENAFHCPTYEEIPAESHALSKEFIQYSLQVITALDDGSGILMANPSSMPFNPLSPQGAHEKYQREVAAHLRRFPDGMRADVEKSLRKRRGE